MMKRYICIHGHFYQPPRENPWLEAIEAQDSAQPFHDWNERISQECYATNGSSRVLDAQGRISRIVNNYARISFNFGPTLLSWLEVHDPSTYQAILRADKLSQERFEGHGSALAQVYNHMIMPLANARDRRTQVIWGLRDFERRFGRQAEGMWLAETAVDLATLEVLAEHGVKFTILAPHQAAKIRPWGAQDWLDVSAGRVDPTRPYTQRLPNGRQIVIFFYDGPISQAIAFERLLERGESLAARLTGAFHDRRPWPQLVHIATDGETYGHHHRHGEMALSYALEHIERQGLAEITVYSLYLARHPPTHEVQIQERTAWSCAHGVERWRDDCGCSSGGHPGWRQAWRKPLRQALDWLRDSVAVPYEQAAQATLHDPWAARDAYIDLVLDRSDQSLDSFLARHATHALDEDQLVRTLELLELQRHAMLMYTSCGWFFDDISGIETVQILQYAARVAQLAKLQLGLDLEPQLLERLSAARSNVEAHRDGRHLYETQIRPTILQLRRVCAHYAIDSLFHDNRSSYCYEIKGELRRVHDAGKTRMAMGVAQITSTITRRSESFEYAVLHLGDHNVTGGTRQRSSPEAMERAYQEAVEAFERAEHPALIRLLDRQFGDHVFTLRSLFRDEQRRVIERVMRAALDEAEAVYRQLYEHRAPLMSFLTALKQPLPEAFHAAACVALNQELRRFLQGDEPPRAELHALIKEAAKVGVKLDWSTLSYDAHHHVVRAMRAFTDSPTDLHALTRWVQAVELAAELPFEVSLWESQNTYMEAIPSTWVEQQRAHHPGQEPTQTWLALFSRLAELLHISPAAFARYA